MSQHKQTTRTSRRQVSDSSTTGTHDAAPVQYQHGLSLLGPQRAALAAQIGQVRDNQLLQHLFAAVGQETLSSEGTVVQRQPSPQLPDDAAQRWSSAGGDELIAAVKADVAGWKVYRQAPFASADMPGAGASAAIGKFLNDIAADAELAAWAKSYASTQIGSADLAYLGELMSMNEQFSPEVGRIFNVSRREPGHSYVLTSHAAVGLLAGAAQSVIPAVEIRYKNNFGMNWSHTLHVPGINFTLGLGTPAPPVDVEYDAENPNKIQPTFEPSLEVSPGVEVGPLQIDVEGQSEARPINYHGISDLSGMVEIMSGPSADVQFNPAVGGSFATGAGFRFSGQRSVPLLFDNFTVSFSPTNKLVSQASFSLVGMGLGYALPGETRIGQASEYEPQIVPDQRQWALTIYYPTGEALIPDTAINQLVAFSRQIQDEMQQFKIVEDRDYLQQRGVGLDQALAMNASVVGYASRSGGGAGGESNRIGSNEQLALDRAQAIVPLLQKLSLFDGSWPGSISISAAGRGAGTMGKSYEGEATPFLQDPAAEQTYRLEKEKVNASFDQEVKSAMEYPEPMRSEKLASIEAARKRELAFVDQTYGPRSDVAEARRVEITVTWNGSRVAHELPSVPAAGGQPKPA